MTGEIAATWREQGYHVCHGALSAAEVTALNAESERVCRQHLEGVSSNESSEAVMRRALAIHFPHKLSPLTRDSMRHPRIVEILTRIIGPNVKSMQSMLFLKSAGKPGQAWHQDEVFIPTRDRSLTGGWIALDDATIDNGCLWVIPGSHRQGILWPMRKHSDPEYDSAPSAYDFPYDDSAAVPVEVEAGSVVFFNGYLLHRSLRNRRREGFRRALVHHYMSAESLLPWDCGGQIPPTRDNRDIVMIAGTDPYAYLGTTDTSRPYVRLEDPSQHPRRYG